MERKTTVLLMISITYFVPSASTVRHHIVLRSTDNLSSVDDLWWRTAIFYQIYPRSFKDSDGDGYGDLQGIISKLDHLEDMGISAAWLSPIYKSPGIDQGYDISDYRDIDPIFGNITDLQILLDKAHGLGIKIVMDFVPNHTSDEHEWFLKSVSNDPEYRDYYIWRDGTKGVPPNNWISLFGGSAWEYNDERKQFYLHQFAPAQPDLNYRNAKVVEEMKDVLRYWLEFGIDGFRMDAVPFLFEDPEFKDEPLSGAANTTANQYAYLKHIYTENLDETYDMIYQFRAVIDEFNRKVKDYTRIMMTEAYTDSQKKTIAYYGNTRTNGAHFSFNFNFLTDVTTVTPRQIISAANKWLSHLDKKYISNWLLGNHDQHRVGSRLGTDNIDGLNMLTAFLPGIQVTYMGEEIGMEDGEVTCEEGHDPQAIKNCSMFDKLSRDFERTPFQWDDSENAGFSTNASTWLPVSKKYKIINLKAQNVNGINSHYNIYKDMVKFRQNFRNISYDAVSLIELSETVLQIVRITDKGEFVYIFNTGDRAEKVNVFKDRMDYRVLVTSGNSKHSVGDILPNPVTLQPHESLVFTAITASRSNSLISVWMLILFSIPFSRISC